MPFFRKPRGVIIALHGLGHSGRIMAYYTALHNVARKEKLAVVYPDGLDTKDYRRGWNAGFCCGSGWKHNHQDEEFLLELIKHIQKQHPTARDVFFVGYSNGAMMTHVMAANHPSVVSAGAAVAGSVGTKESGISPSEPVPMLLVHGRKDKIVPFKGGKAMGNRLIWKSFKESIETWQQANKNVQPVKVIAHPAGHRWPHWRLWRIWNRYPAFSREIVSFFAEQLSPPK